MLPPLIGKEGLGLVAAAETMHMTGKRGFGKSPDTLKIRSLVPENGDMFVKTTQAMLP